jgi:hypothetical protein
MNSYNRPQSSSDCPPKTEHPADQPRKPGSGEPCAALPTTTPPTLPPPARCPPPDSDCWCPTTPSPPPSCLEDLISKQASDIAAAEKAKLFKTDLEALLAKAKAATQEYTRDKYDALVKLWLQRDADLAELIRKLVCAVPCWRCIIDCYVCPMLNELHYAEVWLYGDGTQPSDVHNLYDLQAWHARDRDAKDRRLQRIRGVLGAWEKPAQSIEKILTDNKAAIEAANKSLGTEAGKVVYDVFLRLVPMHLAIAPPVTAERTTRIDREYTEFCGCDSGEPDDCCGPDVGTRSLRQRLIGPQPYLVDPNEYYKIICCLVEKRFAPAKEALAASEAAGAAIDAQIKTNKALLENWTTSFDKTARAAIPSVIDCCDYRPRDSEKQTTEAR